MAKSLDERQQALIDRLRSRQARYPRKHNYERVARALTVTADASDDAFEAAIRTLLKERPEFGGGGGAGYAEAQRRFGDEARDVKPWGGDAA